MRNLLDPDALHPAIRDDVETFHNAIVQEVIQAVAANKVVVVGMRYNAVVKKARKSLDAVGIAFTYLEYGSYTSQWHDRLAIKMWSGWPTFPMIFADQKLIGGNAELQKLLSNPDATLPSLLRR